MDPKKAKKADQAHQDPRSGADPIHDPHMKAHNRGARADSAAIKTRGVPRMNTVINWFRKAPKHKE